MLKVSCHPVYRVLVGAYRILAFRAAGVALAGRQSLFDAHPNPLSAALNFAYCASGHCSLMVSHNCGLAGTGQWSYLLRDKQGSFPVGTREFACGAGGTCDTVARGAYPDILLIQALKASEFSPDLLAGIASLPRTL